MTSKTFNGFASDRELTVKGYDDGSQVDLLVRRSTTGFGVTGIAIAPADAPALALAILEAAGAHKDSQDFLGGAVEQLKFHIGEQERITAEARERAELEAEALGLAKAGCEAVGDESAQNLSDMTDKDQRFFLAVARRAREMRAEK